MRSYRLVLAGLALLALSGCAGRERQILIDEGPHAEASPIIDPDDQVMARSIQTFLKDNKAPLYSEYEFTRTDLDADGRRDALVLFKNPYGFWCDGNGCTMLVLKANNESFSLVGSVQPIRTPLEISDLTQNGWRTMIARVSGRNAPPKDVALAFDGTTYPQDPSDLPPFNTALLTGNEGIRVFP